MYGTSGVIENKERILLFIKSKGPSLPVQVAKDIGVSLIFASAFLSDLKGEDKILVSNMKVGSSSLYYLPGQETELEKFVHFLNQREKEAFNILKQDRILEDATQEPAIRVALRAIKDFAKNLRVRINGEERLFWKYYLLSDQEAEKILREQFEKKGEAVKKEEKKVVKKKETVEKQTKVKEDKEKKEIQEKLAREVAKEVVKKKAKKKAEEVLEETEFVKNVKDYLNRKDIEVLESITERKKEFEAKIRVDTMFGKQEYYLIAKEKKSVSENDFAVALQKAQTERMPALFLTNGELDKKGKGHFDKWKNLVKFEKLN